MSVNPQTTPQDNAPVEIQRDAKQDNIVQLRKIVENERAARFQAEKEMADMKAAVASRSSKGDEEDTYDEPYVDKRYLQKSIAKSMQQMQEEADKRAEHKMRTLLAEEKKSSWLKSNPDFGQVMEHAQKFADSDPELAEAILEMPEGFERQKLVYKNIKALGLHKPKESIQTQVDKNQRSPLIMGNSNAPPYGIANGGKNYTPAEGKNAYDQMMALKSRLRLG